MICGGAVAPSSALRKLTELMHCCMGAATSGPDSCTCWEVVEWSDDQVDPDTSIEPAVRTKMCADCAFRPDSPERSGDERYTGGDGTLFELDNFWCHEGIRKPLRWRHRSGITIEVADVDDYTPVIIDGVPYKADGTPGDRCAGHAAHQRALGADVTELVRAVGEALE